MDKYLELMDLIQQYLNYPDVDSNVEIISAYDLIQLLNGDLEELREAVNKKNLEERINKRYSQIATSKKFLFKKSEVTNSVPDRIDFISFKSSGNKSEVSVQYISQCNIDYHDITCRSAGFARDLYSKDIYYERFDKKKDEYLITEFLDDIIRIFDVLEKYRTRYQSSIRSSSFEEGFITETQKFSDGFLDISIELGPGFMMMTSVSINESVDPERVFRRQWVDKITISDFIEKNKSSILKKIPIYVQDLNDVFVSIIKETYNKPAPKTLIRTSDKI